MKQLRYWREKYMDTKKPVKTYVQFTDPKAVWIGAGYKDTKTILEIYQ